MSVNLVGRTSFGIRLFLLLGQYQRGLMTSPATVGGDCLFLFSSLAASVFSSCRTQELGNLSGISQAAASKIPQQ